MSRPRTSGLPRCPKKCVGHVVRWGHYGGKHLKGSGRPRTSRRRHRFRCIPRRGKTHTFTETLPRTQPRAPAPVTCIECERRFSGLDAPAGPRKHSFSVAEITTVLLLVGQVMQLRARATVTVRR